MTNPAIKNIVDQISDMLAPIDAKNLEAGIEDALKLRTELFAKIEELAPGRRRMSAEEYYAILFRIAGGKTGYALLHDNSPEIIAQKITKSDAHRAEIRNAKIADKLVKAGVETCSDAEIRYSHDGFQGCYKVQTNVGEKWVTIDVIIAGGYNIQRAHYRCLVKVR